MQWKQSYAYNGGFYSGAQRGARGVSAGRRSSAISPTRWTARPRTGIVDALARLKRGELLSPGLDPEAALDHGATPGPAPQRLKGGLAAGLAALATRPAPARCSAASRPAITNRHPHRPDGRSYAVAVMIRRTSAPLGHRMAAMQNTVRAVISFDQNMTQLRDGALRRRLGPGQPLDLCLPIARWGGGPREAWWRGSGAGFAVYAEPLIPRQLPLHQASPGPPPHAPHGEASQAS